LARRFSVNCGRSKLELGMGNGHESTLATQAMINRGDCSFVVDKEVLTALCQSCSGARAQDVR
jgi:hypothetical protein